MLVKGSIRALLVLLLGLPAAAFSLGLGDIHLLSPLNAPLDAEIELLEVTPEELNSLQAQIASKETFARYGLEFPAYLNGVKVQIVRAANGHEIIKLRSTDAITQPFITVLVELNWARGRDVHEYTMLLDPPVYTPGQPSVAATPVTAPKAGAENKEGAIARNTPPPAVTPAPAPLPAPAASNGQGAPAETAAAAAAPQEIAPPVPAARVAQPEAGDADKGTYVVHSGETLTGIASHLSEARAGSPQTQIWMMAIYQANPQAFQRNMNMLHSGAVLRVPEATQMQTISATQAAAEIHRQYVAWRDSGHAPVARAGAARGSEGLKLVTPSEPVGTEEGTHGKARKGGGEEVAQEGNDTKRLAQMKDAELAAMQSKLAKGKATQGAPPPEPTTSQPAARAAEPAQAATQAAEPPMQPPTPPALETPAAGDEDSIFDTLKDLWWVGAVVLLGLVAILIMRSMRSRRQTEFGDSLGRLALAGAGSIEQGFASADDSALGPLSTPDDPFAVEGSETRERSTRTATRRPLEETTTSEVPTGSEGGDPLAEADFHMAYGLYDQAADLIRVAIGREPGRRDLKLKLLEVFFVWGNKEQFLQTARELARSRDASGPGEWEKIVIMGKQLAPQDPLFSGGGPVRGAAAAGVDLDLEAGGENAVDFDLLGDPGEAGGGVDLEVNAPDMTSESASLETGAEFDYGQEDDTSTRQMTDRSRGRAASSELSIDDLGLDLGTLDSESPESTGEATMVGEFDEHSGGTGRHDRGQDDGGGWELEEAMSQGGNGVAHGIEIDAAEVALTGELEEFADAHSESASGLGYGEPQGDADDLALPEMEPATMSEVGTKLDLARAYLDMGDPDGARNILEEVLTEGSASQKQEAQRLMESLPG